MEGIRRRFGTADSAPDGATPDQHGIAAHQQPARVLQRRRSSPLSARA
jgi:hypothetical protein